MGRHQIIGNDFCPVLTCDSLSLGRYVTKKVRNRTNGRYVKRHYYRHNDKKIHEHYVDNYVKKKQNELLQIHPLGEIRKLMTLLANDHDKIGFYIGKIAEQMKDFPLTDQEVIKLNKAIKDKTEMVTSLRNILKLLNLGVMLRIQGKEIPEWLQIEEERLNHLAENSSERLAITDKLIVENPVKAIRKATNIIKSDPIYSIYEKYEFPKRLQRYKQSGKVSSGVPKTKTL